MTPPAAPVTTPWEDQGVCGRCRKPITLFKELWWTEDDDFMCPDGEEQHTPAKPVAQLFTVEGSSYGPYVGLPLCDAQQAYGAHLFTRTTAELIVTDLHRDECGLTAEFAGDGTLTFTWTKEHDGAGGTLAVRPDAHGRYEIGGLWAWDTWGEHIPHTVGQAAFALGATEYRQGVTTSVPDGLSQLYDQGREEAHRVTLHRDAP